VKLEQASKVKSCMPTRLEGSMDRFHPLRWRNCDVIVERRARAAGEEGFPGHLTAPPEDWAVPFARMVEECALKMDAAAAFHEVALYLEGVLALDPGA
jgi:hypothetical protein